MRSLLLDFDISEHYSDFSVQKRTLLTGHSHQAWPNCAIEGQKQAFLDAAELVDNKWDRAFSKAQRLKSFYSDLLGDNNANNYVLAQNTHDLLLRFLSSLDWKKSKRIITSDGEFHSMRRQLARLEEEGVEIVRVAAAPAETLCERIKALLTTDTTAVMVSAVMFKSAAIVPNLNLLGESTSALGIPLLVDVYHALNVLPFNILKNGLDNAFFVGGGYKYCQFGEGNCFMRIPDNCDSRPIITGWYAEFGDLEQTLDNKLVQYATGGNKFQGSTYDPTSHYRASSVIDFFQEQNLSPEFLRELSQHQVGLLRETFDNLDCDPKKISRADVPLQNIAGFLSLKSENAAGLQKILLDNNIMTDQRDGYLRLGPAPYLSDKQLKDAVMLIGESI